MKVWNGLLAAAVCLGLAPSSQAVEIITKQTLKDNVLRKEMLVRVADNGVFLLDTSSSTNAMYDDTGKPLVQVMKSELLSRNQWFPDLGHNIGIYTYTGWQDNYPIAKYNREGVASALQGVRDKGGGNTPLASGLNKLNKILDQVQGRTAVFVFWDGEATVDPVAWAREVIAKHDVCYYLISGAKGKREAEMSKNISDLNACSRVIPLSQFFAHPEYSSAALWDVKVTEHPVPQSPLNFTFNGTELDDGDKAHLDEIAAFLNEHQGIHVVAAGYTDDVGSRDYNEKLSRKRAEMVGGYLKSKGVADDRVVLLWYGLTNPLVPNDTEEGRAKNRRVEVKVSLDE
jgi:outer membrane protein OmpA-like peptidoglycan-associated protein